MKASESGLYATEVVPIAAFLRGERTDFRVLWAKAKEKPLHFVYESFALAMMGVGAWVTVEWAYRTGYQVGFWL